MSHVISRQRIALLADEAAQAWTEAWLQDPAAPKPANPYDKHIEPDAHSCWEASFHRSLLAHSALPETEVSC